MNNLFLNPPPHSTNQYWNPLNLAISTKLKKTCSYENLPLEDKIVRLENDIANLQKSYSEINECRDIFFKRIFNLINQCDESETYKKDFYEESPRFMQNDDFIYMFETLNWLTYSDNIKKELLDKDIENYFMDSPVET